MEVNINNSTHAVLLRAATGATPFEFLHCSLCNNIADAFHQHDTYSWAVNLTCNNCHTSWSTCKVCLRPKTRYTQRVQLRKHETNCHAKVAIEKANNAVASDTSSDKAVASSTETTSADAAVASDIIAGSMLFENDSNLVAESLLDFSNDVDMDTAAKLNKFQKFLSTLPFHEMNVSCGNEASNNYFRLEQARPGLGISNIVANSQFRVEIRTNPLLNEDTINDILDGDEVQYHLRLARLLSLLTVGNNNLLADVISRTVAFVKKQMLGAQEGRKMTSIPMTFGAMRSQYLEGKYAILANLPKPKIILLDDHAYVSLSDCVSDLLAHGYILDYVPSCNNAMEGNISGVKHIRETKRAMAIAQRAHAAHDKGMLILYFNEWSDDFEPNKQSKSNRGSVWIKTVTISPPQGSIHCLSYTYPIAVGRKGVSHDIIESAFAKELAIFRSPSLSDSFFCAATKRNVKVYMELFASLQDQPERRGANYIMLGNSKFSARWGYAVDVAAVVSGIPSCKKCFEFLLEHINDEHVAPECDSCAKWLTDCTSGILDFIAPKDYPNSELLNLQSRMLRPLQLSYDVLVNAVDKAHQKIVHDEWSINSAKEYMNVHGLNTECVDAVISRAKNCRLLQMQEDGTSELGADAVRAINRERARTPEMYEKWKTPSLWCRGTDFIQSVDVVMHLLFLGVVKTTVRRIQQWLKLRGKSEPFLVQARKMLPPIQALRLSWCKAIKFPGGKMGGWVSENYVALVRIFPWFYSNLPIIAVHKAYVMPTKPQKKWTVVENKSWLIAHGLKPGKLLALPLRELVEGHMSAPPAPVTNIGGVPATVSDVVNSLCKMTGAIMDRVATAQTIERMKRSIQTFLSYYDVLDSNIRKSHNDDNCPGWISSYNFCCLMNLPNTVKEFGPMRNLWEGGGQGEKVLSIVKRHMAGFKTNWQTTLLNNVMRDVALTRIQQKANEAFPSSAPIVEPDDSTFEQLFLGARPREEYMLYKSSHDARKAFALGKPLSVVEVQGIGLCIAVKKGILIPIRAKTEEVICVSACCYHTFQLDSEEIVTTGDAFVRAVLFLPRLAEDGMPTAITNKIGLYCAVDSEWNYLDNYRNFNSL